MKYDLCIIGGAGHVGLPLGVSFANKNVKTVLLDVNLDWLKKIQSGSFPFKEENGDQELKSALKKKSLFTSDSPKVIAQSKYVLIVIGTPVDEYLNPDFNSLTRVIDLYMPHFKNNQVLILRSTVYPGTSERIQKYFNDQGKKVHVAFCPERVVQGKSLEELAKFPQVIAAFEKSTLDKVSKLFKKISSQIIICEKPIEAELIKLFSNAWRYITFAIANQFFMIAEDNNLDYQKIYEKMVADYERNRDLPKPGFAAGPCLLKDTLQLAAFSNNNFFLGHSAMLVNEGLPNFLVQRLKQKVLSPNDTSEITVKLTKKNSGIFGTILNSIRSNNDLKSKTVGILGMAFKADSDDPRDSLSYKLRKIAAVEAKEVLCHDVYIKDPSFHSLEKVLNSSDIIIMASPHKEYKNINPKEYPNKMFIDIWNFLK